MWPATVFSVARGNIQDNFQIWSILQLVNVSVSVEANLNWDLLQTMRGLLKVAPEPNYLPTPAIRKTYACHLVIFVSEEISFFEDAIKSVV